jgi:ribosomal protein S18 acetylase RimI-like enzyme
LLFKIPSRAEALRGFWFGWNSEMRIERVISAEGAEFDALVRIYTEALPAIERKSADVLARMIERPEYFFLAAIEDSAVVGFAIAIALVDSDAALLEYLAVDRARRGMGIGASLFHATAAWPGLCGRSLLVEVEAEAARTKKFYRQLGARQIEGLAYQMPPVSSAQPPAMDMLVCAEQLPDALEKVRVRGWLEACYLQVYGVAADDARIHSMVGTLPHRIRVI